MRTIVVVFCATLLAGAAVVSGQAQRAGATLDDVVNELRALRAEMKQTTRATTQMQLLTARLSLQEQRLAVLSNQHNEVAAKLMQESQLRANSEAQVRTFEETKARNQDLGISREELEGTLKAFQQQFEMHRGLELQLRTQESQLATEIANEQARWQDFNSRLDELERSLK